VIQANKAELETLVTAVKSSDAGQVKEILSKNGFDPDGLELNLSEGKRGPLSTAKIKIWIT
jgi:hypothetical protein